MGHCVTALPSIMEAMANQITAALSGTADPLIEQLQVTPLLNINPTPPSIDIYPADPFQEGLAFGTVNNELRFSVRARVTTADHEAGQTLLLNMMDPAAATSLASAIASDRKLGNTVQSLSVEGPSGFGIYQDAGGEGSLLGAVWTVRVFP
jgi:hypothetical protein